jgi:hypothetical protein
MLRSRLASLLLLLASPAVGGTVLPVAHPCPVDAPWLAPDQGGHEHGNHHQQSQSPTDQSGHSCTCPGMGAAGLGVAIPSGFGTVILVPAPEQSLPASADPDARWTRAFLDLLPPSTAPPIA